MGDDDEYTVNTIMKPFFRPATYSDLVALLKKAGVSGDPQQLRGPWKLIVEFMNRFKIIIIAIMPMNLLCTEHRLIYTG